MRSIYVVMDESFDRGEVRLVLGYTDPVKANALAETLTEKSEKPGGKYAHGNGRIFVGEVQLDET